MLSITESNLDRLAAEASDWVAVMITRLAEVQSRVVVALPGGNSPTRLFQALARRTDLPWKQVHLFMLDERLVPLDHVDSNYRQVQELFVDPLVERGVLPPDNAHPFFYDSTVADAGLMAYQQDLASVGGRFDIVIAGVGEDGHTAALFPRHAALSASQDFVTLSDSPKPPAGRMTATPALLAKTQAALVLFIGEGKRQAYINWSDPAVSVEDCPSKLFSTIPDLVVASDLSLA